MSRPDGALPTSDAPPQSSNVPDQIRISERNPTTSSTTMDVVIDASANQATMDLNGPATPIVRRYRHRAWSSSSPATPQENHRRFAEVDDQATPTPANVSRILELSNGIGGLSLGGGMIVAASLARHSQLPLVQSTSSQGITVRVFISLLTQHNAHGIRACVAGGGAMGSLQPS